MASVDEVSEGFSPGKFGIPEPGPKFQDADSGLKKSVSWLVPGLVFDRKGNRLGHGRGVFDLLLSDAEGLKIGICFEKQITDSVPVGKSDVKMDLIVTETGVRTCRNGGIRL
jgi:5-formyltetrahydrofolate cyclo-ligase